MSRPRKTLSIDERIEHAQAEVFRCKDKYDAALAELAALQKRKSDMQKKELLAALEKSDRSYEEIMAFLVGSAI